MATRLLLVAFWLLIYETSDCVDIELGLGFAVEPGGVNNNLIVIQRKDSVLLQCRPSTPRTTVTWTLNFEPLVLESRHVIFSNGSLLIKKIIHKKKSNVSDEGIYRCVISNSYGVLVSKPVHLMVATIAHNFDVEPNNVTLFEGNVLRLTCSIESIPKASIIWKRDSQPLPHNSRRFFIDSGILYIANIKQEDAGVYRCIATNDVLTKTRMSREAVIVVTGGPRGPGPPQIFNQSNPRKIEKEILHFGKNASLICAANGNPKPVIKWIQSTRDNYNSTLQRTSNGINVWKIQKVTHASKGRYICTVNNLYGEDYKIIETEVHYPPVLVNNNKPKSQSYPTARTVRIECHYDAFPMVPMLWLRNGTKLKIDGRIKQFKQDLIIGGPVAQDTGIYQCIIGDIWGAARILITTPSDSPPAPTKLKCTVLSSTEIRLSWTRPPLMSDLKAYSVHYFPTDGGEDNKDVAQNETLIIQKLSPFTNYTFSVRAYGRVASAPSKEIICSTAETVPTGGPVVNIVKVGAYCFVVSWIPPPASRARGMITQYKVQWKRINQTSTNFEVLPGFIHNYSVSGLQSGTGYMVRVIGATSLGWPDLNDKQAPWTNVSTSILRNDALQPPIVHLKNINDSTVLVEWTYENIDNIDGFKLFYRKLTSEKGELINLLPNTTYFILTQLESRRWYEITISAYSMSDESETCAYSVLTLGNSVGNLFLPEIIDVEAHAISSNSLNVSWPSLNEASYYLVTYEILQTFEKLNSTEPTSINTSSSSIVMKNLRSNTLYAITVVAHGQNGKISPPSRKVESRTYHDIPGQVQNVDWRAINSTTVKIFWKSFGNMCGIIHYELFYLMEKDANDNFEIWTLKTVPPDNSSFVLTNLFPNVKYVVRVRATTASGNGLASEILKFEIPTAVNKNDYSPTSPTSKPSNSQSKLSNDQLFGIIIGLSISACCIIACLVTLIICRRRCSKSVQNHERQGINSNHDLVISEDTQQEILSLSHISTKQQYYPNGDANGVSLPLISNGGILNGHIHKEKGLRITENPQYDVRSYNSKNTEEGSRTTDEGDSLLSGPELEMEMEETQITGLEVSVTKDTLPDDGFHENNISLHQVPNTV